ncbi:hypothetical protein H8D57_00850 [bacterium]|nr:hypothetical protein [bacterium]
MITIEGGTAQEVKDMVIDEGGDGLIGVIFAGELPLAWYEHREHFYNENEPDNQRIIEYPIDLFFTDLDGVWEDTTGNGIYDHHYGEVDPDIWLGRIPAYNLSRIDENEIVGAYLQKTIQYKQNELSAPHKALNYIDDDWDRLDEKWTADIRNLFGEITSESDSNTTCVPDYVEHLEGEGYELIQVAVHSSSDAHIFYIDNRSNRDYFRFWDLRDDIVPNAMFYNLFACSVMNFAPQENRPRNLCLGVLYALGGEYGLGSIGSTKTGGMLSFDDFYQPLSDGDCFGEALRKWMVEHAHEEDNPNWARSWFYGMTYYGDPTLKIRQGLRINSPIAFDPEGDNDLILDAGETVELICNLANKAEIPFENITLNLECANENVEIINGQVEIDGIDAGEEIQAFGFQFAVNESFLNNDRISFNLEMSMENDIWRDWFELTVKAPVLEIVGFGIGEVSGNGNNLTEPGETGELIIHFQNTGGDDMHQEGQVHLTDMRNFIEIEDNPGVLPLTEIGNIGFSQLFNFSVSGDAENEQIIYLDVENSINGVMRGQGFIGLPVSTAFEFDEYLDLEPVWFKHYSLSDNFYDFWRWDEDAGLDGGGFAIGGPDSTEYPPFCDAALELPLFLYDSDAILEVQHRFDVNQNMTLV